MALLWTKERCLESAKEYDNITEWKDECGGAYASALKHGWKDECTAHMIRRSKPRGFYNLETVTAIASQFDTIDEWKAKSSGSYSWATRNKKTVECTPHIKRKMRVSGYWNEGTIVAHACLFDNQRDFNRAYPSARSRACHIEIIPRLQKLWIQSQNSARN